MLSEEIGTAADTLLPTINAMDDLAIEKQIRTLSNRRDSLSGVRSENRGGHRSRHRSQRRSRR